ncbi:MAG: OsmC family protein [Armatimonadota bacterium]
MPIRTADAEWKGNLREGHGRMRLGGGAFEGAYTFISRFEAADDGTNPDDLIAAAHASCFSMALSGELANAGFTPTRIHTTAKVHVDKTGDGFGITAIELITEAEVPGIDNETFQEKAMAAKVGCPVSRALACVPQISLDARLITS